MLEGATPPCNNPFLSLAKPLHDLSSSVVVPQACLLAVIFV